jgi:hypothetical protein
MAVDYMCPARKSSRHSPEPHAIDAWRDGSLARIRATDVPLAHKAEITFQLEN